MTCTYECVGGALPVTEGYVEAQIMRLPAHTVDEVRVPHRAALRNSVSPCPSCRPEQYELWRGGHFAPNHSCGECRPKRGKAKR